MVNRNGESRNYFLKKIVIDPSSPLSSPSTPSSSSSFNYLQFLHETYKDPTKYFTSTLDNHKIIFGKKSTKPPPLFKSIMRKSQQLRPSRASLSMNASKALLSTSINTQQSQSYLPPNKYYIDDREIKGIFDNFRNIKVQNSLKGYNDYNTIGNADIKNEEGLMLTKQNKVLTNHNSFNKTATILSKHIARKLKTNKDKLLMVTSTDFRIKKELKDNNNAASGSLLTESKANLNWISSLRSDNENRYLNLGTPKHPDWQLMIATKSTKEIIRNPSREIINNNNTINQSNTVNTRKRKHTYSNSVNFKDLEVKGVDLLQFEYENIKGIKGKKIIIKYPKYEIDSNKNNNYNCNNNGADSIMLFKDNSNSSITVLPNIK